MDILAVQRILAATTYYKGGLDGDMGPQTQAAIEIIERTQQRQYMYDAKAWSWKRRAIAAAQAVLNVWKFEAGEVDGYAGHNTTNAYQAWEFKRFHNKRETVVRRKASTRYDKSRLPHQRDVKAYYGTPGKTTGTVRQQLTIVKLPFKLHIDYNMQQTTNKITVHKKAASSLRKALIATEAHYGLDGMHTLGIDRYAGAYNPRKMRGGTKWSMHAYGCAIDFYAKPNGLRMRCPEALFCGPRYKAFLDIMEEHGWLPALRLWGADAMHFQRARL